MKLQVTHTTCFEYDEPVHEIATELRLYPSDNGTGVQRTLNFRLQIHPQAKVHEYQDYYGNTVHHFSLMESLKNLEITAISDVETGLTAASHVPNHVELEEFLTESRYATIVPIVREFAAQFPKDAPPHILAHDIAERIFSSFIYEQGVTGVHSTVDEVMALGRGVCQDFAHLMLATCRCLRVPARYISGYLYGGLDTETHARASHAWCEVYCGPNFGWQGFDPTHEQLLVNEGYIRIGTGRDYSDVTLVRGTYKGNAVESLTATVQVTAMNGEPQRQFVS